ncbi:hypothetical protein UF75_4880 [Desulfosporosinus sp. I2]|uniref:hypothetical protein n=1 Tax=Desulfosporosinus sp. I2 TaxID=1617025 RepID=UPI0005F081E6|nr:hypothetical protein [Desulfosporosinus sp. I2]KJR44741.1 hypothetical protein UF75_4880 [Desulfosporosinus sp. I2]
MKEIEFSYKFVKAESIVDDSGLEGTLGLKKDRIFLDAGNRFETGAIDYHQLKSPIVVDNKVCISVAALVAAFPELVLNNLSENAERIEFVLHRSPDMDCIVSVYIAQKLIKEGMLGITPQLEKIIQYVKDLNSGRNKINSDFLKMPNNLVYAIEEIESAKLKKEFKSKGVEITEGAEDEQYFQLLYENIMLKGLKLLEYIADKVSGFAANDGILNSPLLLTDYHGLDEEYELIKDDYHKYCREVYGENSNCKQVKIKLPLKESYAGVDEQLKEVDGLKWSDIPECVFPEYWARRDGNAPGNDGYVFTFIPVYKNKAVDTKLLREKKLQREVEVNSVRIAVDSTKNVTLQGLGELLEVREQEKEQTVFDDDELSVWRDRRSKTDGWGYELWDFVNIASPSEGSILSIEEIYDIILAFEKPLFNTFVARIVIPFKYDANLFEEIEPEASLQEGINKEVGNYFLPYINEYYFNNKQKNSKQICKFLRVKTDSIKLIGSDCKLFENNRVRNQNHTDVIVFSHGTGIIYTDFYNNNLAFDKVLEMNYELLKSSKNAVEQYAAQLKDKLNFAVSIEKEYMKLYNYIDADERTFHQSQLKGTLYRIANAIGNKQDYRALVFNEEEKNKGLIQINRSAFFYANRLSSVLYTVNTGSDKTKVRKRIEGLEHDYFKKHFLIFILALDLQMNLIKYAIDLANYGKSKGASSMNHINGLRERLLNFTAVAVFSQITNDDIGMLLYRKWSEIFENKLIHKEVFTQLSALDEFNIARVSRRMEKFSWIFLPIVTLSAFFCIGWVKIIPLVGGNMGLDKSWWYIVIGVCVAWIAYFIKMDYFYKKDN